MIKLTIFLVFLALVGPCAAANETAGNETRSIKLPLIFQTSVYKSILAKRNIVPEIREEDAGQPIPKSIFDPITENLNKSLLNNAFSNITAGLIKPWMSLNSRLSKTASTLPGIFAAKGAMIGFALATPIHMYAQIVQKLARSLNPQMSIHEFADQQNPIFDLPIDPRVAYNEPVSNVLMTLRENAKRIGNQISQMGHDIKNTGKNISSVGYNLLQFSKKATETLSKAPLIPQSYEDDVPISLEPSPLIELPKLANSTQKVVDLIPSAMPVVSLTRWFPTVTLTPKVSSLADKSVVAQNESVNPEEQVQPIVEVVTGNPFSETSKPVIAPVTVAPFDLPVETAIIPELNIVSEEVSSTVSSTPPPVPAQVVVTTIEMLAPVFSSSPSQTETEVLESSTDHAGLQSNQSALNISSNVQLMETLAQSVPLVTSKQQAKVTETTLISEMAPLKVEVVEDIVKNVDEHEFISTLKNDEVLTVENLVPTVNF